MYYYQSICHNFSQKLKAGPKSKPVILSPPRYWLSLLTRNFPWAGVRIPLVTTRGVAISPHQIHARNNTEGIPTSRWEKSELHGRQSAASAPRNDTFRRFMGCGSADLSRILFAVLACCVLAGCSTLTQKVENQEQMKAALLPRAFEPLPLGSIQPRGWLKRQLEIQASGLSGHLDEFWPDIRDSGWIGGTAEGWERVPYWLDGIVPLAYVLDDPALKAKVERWMDYILTHQREDGWLGPAGSKGYKDYDPWPRFVLLKAMAQYQEAAGDERVIPAMQEFFRFLDALLDKQPLFEWGQFRWMDGVWSVHWLYDRTGEEWLLPLAAKLHAQGYDWNAHFADFQYTERVTKGFSLKTHGVNNAMALKAGPVWYRQSGAEVDKNTVYRAIEMLDKYHGQANGVFSADEHYAGLSPSQGSELCLVVEYMFSLENAIAILGDSALADRLERVAYNALPATFKKDMWAHQYDQQVNQVLCKVDKDRPFASNGADANIFGLEPNYGCCTANMHQGWPKFVSSLWMKTKDGLAVISYAPCKVNTQINGKPVHVEVGYHFPFSEAVTIDVQGEGKFAVDLRIPGWASLGKMSIENGPEEIVRGPWHRIERDWTRSTRINLSLYIHPNLERRLNNSGAITFGPLVMALPLGEEWKKIRGEEPHADWEVYPTTPWNYAIGRSRGETEWSVNMPGGVPDDAIPFSADNHAVEFVVPARLVPEWKLEHNAAGPLPASPVKSSEPLTKLKLIPYGCTSLRIAEFPMLEEEPEVAEKGATK